MMLSWHKQQWQFLWEALQKNRLPHAILLVGACELEKKHFAHHLAATFLCINPTMHGSCDVCHICHLVKAQSHPDLLWIEPLEEGQIIKIDQIRELVSKVNETSMQGGLRIVILNPAHSMNTAAANALLKTLEEPAPHTLLLLLSDQPLQLPATISSRCQKIMFHKPSKAIAQAWLQSQHIRDSQLLLDLANGFPLQAIELQTNGMLPLRQKLYQAMYDMKRGLLDPLAFATTCQAFDIRNVLMLLQIWMRDLLRCSLTKGKAKLINDDYYATFMEISSVISIKNSVRYADLVLNAYIKILNRLNLNKQLLLEELWITWTRYVSC